MQRVFEIQSNWDEREKLRHFAIAKPPVVPTYPFQPPGGLWGARGYGGNGPTLDPMINPAPGPTTMKLTANIKSPLRPSHYATTVSPSSTASPMSSAASSSSSSAASSTSSPFSPSSPSSPNAAKEAGVNLKIDEKTIIDLLVLKRKLEDEVEASRSEYNPDKRALAPRIMLSPSKNEKGENLVINTATQEVGVIKKLEPNPVDVEAERKKYEPSFKSTDANEDLIKKAYEIINLHKDRAVQYEKVQQALVGIKRSEMNKILDMLKINPDVLQLEKKNLNKDNRNQFKNSIKKLNIQ